MPLIWQYFSLCPPYAFHNAINLTDVVCLEANWLLNIQQTKQLDADLMLHNYFVSVYESMTPTPILSTSTLPSIHCYKVGKKSIKR